MGALNLCKKVEQRFFVSEMGAIAVGEAIHKLDSLSAVTESYKKFYQIMEHNRRENKPSSLRVQI